MVSSAHDEAATFLSLYVVVLLMDGFSGLEKVQNGTLVQNTSLRPPREKNGRTSNDQSY